MDVGHDVTHTLVNARFVTACFKPLGSRLGAEVLNGFEGLALHLKLGSFDITFDVSRHLFEGDRGVVKIGVPLLDNLLLGSTVELVEVGLAVMKLGASASA